MMDTAVPPDCPSRFRPSTGPNTSACRITRPTSARSSGPPGKEGTGLMKLSSGSRSFLLRLWRPAARRPQVGRCTHMAGHAAPAVVGRPVDGRRALAGVWLCGSDGVEIMEPPHSRDAAGRALRAIAPPTPMRRWRRAGTGKSTNTVIASGAAYSTTPMLHPTPGAGT